MNRREGKVVSEVRKYALEVFEEEAKAISNLSDLLNGEFDAAVQMILKTKGKITVIGVGKSGHIARKIAASLASTGTPSFYLHPTEALHGDLGMLEKSDTILAITNSGETDEVLRLISYFKGNGNKVISLTGNPESTLALNSDVHLNVHVSHEVCPLNLAPTTSATATLVMGHALLVALMHMRSFKNENYAQFHPGGSLGKRLLTKVKDIMFVSELPLVQDEINLLEVISTISESHFGLVVIAKNEIVKGIITDGDLRNAIYHSPKGFPDKKARDIMTRNPVTCQLSDSLVTAKNTMEKYSINTLLVLEQNQFKGLLKYKQVIDL